MTISLSDFISPEVYKTCKVLVSSDNGVTYIGIANYGWDWYNTSSDTWREIWSIMKIEEDSQNGTIEVSRPDGSYDNKYEWDEIDNLDFI